MTGSDEERIDEAYAGFLDAREQDPQLAFEDWLAGQPEAWRGELGELHALTAAVLPELKGTRTLPLQRVSERYVIEGELGAGGMGEVFRVYDRRLERRLAMKVSRRGGRREQRFLAEARVAGRLDHPGIAPVHELDVDAEGRPFFTMAEVRGRTFEDLIGASREGREGWSLTRAVGVLLRVSDAMRYAHSKGVVHRDLKPANVMVGEFGETYVLDWGLAKAAGLDEPVEGAAPSAERPATGSTVARPAAEPADERHSTPDLTADGDVVGTPGYMAPEQARGEQAAVGPPADVYALGCMLYQLLGGRPPYAGVDDVLAAVRERAPDALLPGPGTPAELIAIAERAMRRAPEQRYASMGDMNADLRAYLEGRVVGAYESGGWAELRKWLVRNRRLALALAGLVLALLAGVAATFYFRGLEQARGLRFFDLQLVREAIQEADRDLWPELPERVPAMAQWLARNRRLAARLPLHRATLEATAAEAARLRERELPGPEAGTVRWTFGDPDRRWRFEQLEQLVAELEQFAGPAGTLAEVERRSEWARTVVERTLIEPAEAWERAAAELAADERFSGVELVPQLGLVPLGPDPRSGLQEFALPRSGEPPARAADGQLQLAPEVGCVLVLLPGATFTMGVPPDRATPMLYLAEPAHEVRLAPFFLAKHELTSEQWGRLGGAPEASEGEPLHPARGVTWFESEALAGRHGLALPTEAQWEYAALCGASTRYPWGDAFEDILGYADLRNTGAQPIGRLAPNAFGLHDIVGNITEWCRDARGSYEQPVAGPAALRRPENDSLRAYRGVGFVGFEERAAPTITLPRFRLFSPPATPNGAIGLRLARPLDPPDADTVASPQD